MSWKIQDGVLIKLEAIRKGQMNLEELRGLLLGLYYLGILTTESGSGKLGWPTEVVSPLAGPGGPVVV